MRMGPMCRHGRARAGRENLPPYWRNLTMGIPWVGLGREWEAGWQLSCIALPMSVNKVCMCVCVCAYVCVWTGWWLVKAIGEQLESMEAVVPHPVLPSLTHLSHWPQVFLSKVTPPLKFFVLFFIKDSLVILWLCIQSTLTASSMSFGVEMTQDKAQATR